MFDRTDERLMQWVLASVGSEVDVSVSLEPPGPAEDRIQVGLYLLDLLNGTPEGMRQAAPLELHLRYLVTVWAPQISVQHRVLGELAFAVLEDPELEMERKPPPVQTWTALGIPPRPSFLLRVPVRRERTSTAPPVKLVTQPMILHTTQPTALEGRLVGPADEPIVGAQVTIAALGRRARTDPDGRFDLGVVPLEPRRKRIEIVVKGHRREATIEHPTPDDEPIQIRLDLTEED